MTSEATLPTEQKTRLHIPTESLVREAVLHRLGEPDNLHRVAVRLVSTGQYRVNVFVRADTTFRVAHSYFVQTDDRGRLLESHPPIVRQY